MFSFFNASGVIFDLAYQGGLVLSTSFGVLLVDLSLGIVCETWFANCMIFPFAQTWRFDITSHDHMLEA